MVFKVKPYRLMTAKYCSDQCRLSVPKSESTKKKLSDWRKEFYKNNPHPLKGMKVKHKPKTQEHLKKIADGRKKYFLNHPDAMAGENNPNWKGGTTGKHRTRLTSSAWRKIRAFVIDRDKGKCVLCGCIPENKLLHVHHIRAWRDGGLDEPDNLQSLCASCHQTKEVEHREEQLTEAINKYCCECLGWEDNPRDCTSPLCTLFPFRGTSMASQRSKSGAPSRKDAPHIYTNTPKIDGKPLATTE